MTATDRTTPTVPAVDFDRDRSGYAGFFTGRGDTSTAHGLAVAYTPDPPPEPATLALLPVGRRLLSATTEHDYLDALGAFVTGWRAAGCGDATSDHADPPPALGTCPPADGDHGGHWSGAAYTFDNGEVLYYPAVHERPYRPGRGQWHTITLTGAPAAPRVDLTPASRRYGKSYLDTWALDLPALAAWLMAELTALGRNVTSAVWPDVRYAAVANTARDEIKLYLYGLDDTPGTRRPPGDADRRAFDEITALAAAHGWSNPHDDTDRRFGLLTHVGTAYDGPDLRAQGRGPGTITVIDDPNPLWN
ncbi:hypothetical protein [Amycolatopsis minnesotensis]|uniref:Uncharacterized protein n=1 Tax=Amycolatopsis minnesotensis TaxID=337894 RepID=A0ABP5B9L5_9PSEU